MAKFKKLAVVSSSLLATAMLAAFGVACDQTKVCDHKFEKKANDTHTWYECTNDGCDLKVGEEAIPATHTHDFKVKNNDTNTKTWYECECGAKTPEKDVVAPHSHAFVKKQANGKIWYECECGVKTPEEDVVSPHTHAFELKKDADGHWYECDCDVKVGEEDHIWDEGEETKAPQVGVEGEYTYTCLVCGQTETEPVDALEKDNSIKAEGKVTVKNSYNGGNSVTVNLPAGNYILIASCNLASPEYNLAIDENTSSWSNTLQFEVTEAGDVTINVKAYEYGGNPEEDVEVSYIIKELLPIEFDGDFMFGEVEILDYAWVKVNVTLANVGTFIAKADNVSFSATPDGGEPYFVINTTQENEAVSFYIMSNTASDAGVTTITYTIETIRPKDAYEMVDTNDDWEPDTIKNGPVAITIYEGLRTEITFKAEESGFYTFNTYDTTLAIYESNNSEEDYIPLNQNPDTFMLTQSYTFEYDAATEKTFFLTSGYGVTMISITKSNDGEIDGGDEEPEEPAMEDGSQANPYIIDANGEAYTDLAFTAHSMLMGQFYPIYFSFTASANGIVDICNINNPGIISNDNGQVDYIEDTTAFNVVAGMTYIIEIGVQDLAGSPISPEFIFTESAGEEPTEDGSYGAPFVVEPNGEEFTDVVLPSNPMTGMTSNAYFSYTATQSGYVSISNVNSIGAFYEVDGAMVEPATADGLTYAVVAGTTYSIEIGAQDLAGSPISPVFSFSTEAPVEEPTEDGSYGAPFVVEPEGEVFTDVVLPTNPMTGMTANAYFSYTATQSGYVSISNVNSISGFYSDGGFADPVTEDGLTYEVVVGTTYTIEIGQQDMAASPISPVFAFSTEAPVEEPTEDGSFGAPYVVDAAGEVFTDVALPTNPMSGATLNAYFTYTATQSGTLTVNGTGEVKAFYPENDSPMTPVEGTTYEVVVGTTYIIEVGAADEETAVSPVFVFAANA